MSLSVEPNVRLKILRELCAESNVTKRCPGVMPSSSPFKRVPWRQEHTCFQSICRMPKMLRLRTGGNHTRKVDHLTMRCNGDTPMRHRTLDPTIFGNGGWRAS